MKSDRRTAVAIVGGGFSGSIVAAQLARRGIGSVLIDGSGRIGRGVAYSTAEPAHLLNVRAESMSAWPDRPDDFAQRLASEGGEPGGFAERRLFGRYLADILDDSVASTRTRIARSAATSAKHHADGWRIGLEDGETVEADALVLALGNQQPEPLSAFAGSHARYLA